MADHIALQAIGCGDAFGSGGQFHTCFLLHDHAGLMALDFGASSLVALRAAGIDPHSIDTIVLSHFHGDHMGGLPFLLLDRQFGAKCAAPLTIAGPPGLRAHLRTLTEALFPGTWREDWGFALTLIEITPDQPVQLGARRIVTTAVRHATGPYQATALRVETGGKVVAYSGDTGWVDTLIDISANCDLFICECFEWDEQPYGGHISLPTLRGKLPQITARRMVLNHLGPEMIAHRDEVELEVMVEGMTYRL